MRTDWLLLAGLLIGPSALAQGAPPAAGSWKMDSTIADSIVDFRLASSAPVKTADGKVFPALALRCRNGKLTVRIAAEMTLDVKADRTPVSLRWDGGKAEDQMWRVTASVDEVIVPDATAFVSRLSRTQRLRVELAGDRRKSVTVEFAPHGLSALGAALTRACPKVGLDSTFAIVPTGWQPVPSEVVNGETWYHLPQVDSPVRLVPGTFFLTYPLTMRVSGINGLVTAEFVVDTNGRADMSTFKVTQSNHESFSKAVRDGVAAARYFPAEIDERKVKQLVRSDFTFTVP